MLPRVRQAAALLLVVGFGPVEAAARSTDRERRIQEDEVVRLGKRPGAIRAAQMRGLQALARMLRAEYRPQFEASAASEI